MRDKSIVAAIIRKNDLGELTALPEQEILCPCSLNHQMFLENTTGQWYCSSCENSGDIFSLYSLAFNEPNMDYVRRIVWYYRTHLVPVSEIGRHSLFAHLNHFERPKNLPKATFAELAPQVKYLLSIDSITGALKDLMHWDKKDIVNNRIGLIGTKSKHYILLPNIIYGELISYDIFDPYVNTVLGNRKHGEEVQWINCRS